MKLTEIYDQIVALNDYKPSKKVNRLFSALVLKAIDSRENEMLSKKKCGCLQKICSHAEYEMEKYWAQEIIKGNKSISEFTYYTNYKDLTRLEWNALASCSDHKHHTVLFVGSGPLPMTAIILACNYNIRSTLIDNDPVAVELSRVLIQVLKLEQMITIICADGSSYVNYNNFNVIFVAALVGTHSYQKEKIFNFIQKNASSHTHVIARSSWGKRKLLYPPLPPIGLSSL